MTGGIERHTETALAGGTSNRGLIFRVGDTVRRPAGPASEGVHALLKHLEDVGFDGAPRFLGLDEQGREVLTYIEGEVPIAPTPAWALSDEVLASVVGLLRRYHQAASSFDPEPYAWPTTVPPGYVQDGLVSHNDPNLDNIVFRDGKAVALIDFDLASPGSPLWDIALAGRLWIPLRDPRDVHDERADSNARRLQLVADTYDLPESDRRRLPAAALATHNWSYAIVDAGSRRGQLGYLEYWTPDAQARAERGRSWLAANAAALRHALRVS